MKQRSKRLKEEDKSGKREEEEPGVNERMWW